MVMGGRGVQRTPQQEHPHNRPRWHCVCVCVCVCLFVVTARPASQARLCRCQLLRTSSFDPPLHRSLPHAAAIKRVPRERACLRNLSVSSPLLVVRASPLFGRATPAPQACAVALPCALSGSHESRKPWLCCAGVDLTCRFSVAVFALSCSCGASFAFRRRSASSLSPPLFAP